MKYDVSKEDDDNDPNRERDDSLDGDGGDSFNNKKKTHRQAMLQKQTKSFKDILGESRHDSCLVAWHFDLFAEVEELRCIVKYSLRAATENDMNKIIDCIEREKMKYAEGFASISTAKFLRRRLRSFYDVYTSFGIMAGLLVANFIIDIVQSEMQPAAGTREARIFQTFDIVFTLLFTLDLAINFLSHSTCTFFRKGWNLFDLVIISISLASIASADGSSINTFRTIRAIRAVRLLNGVSQLRAIVDALLISVRVSELP